MVSALPTSTSSSSSSSSSPSGCCGGDSCSPSSVGMSPPPSSSSSSPPPSSSFVRPVRFACVGAALALVAYAAALQRGVDALGANRDIVSTDAQTWLLVAVAALLLYGVARLSTRACWLATYVQAAYFFLVVVRAARAASSTLDEYRRVGDVRAALEHVTTLADVAAFVASAALLYACAALTTLLALHRHWPQLLARVEWQMSNAHARNNPKLEV